MGLAAKLSRHTHGMATGVSAALLLGIIAPITIGLGENVNGPTNVSIGSVQEHSGNSSGGSVTQTNSNSSTTIVDVD